MLGTKYRRLYHFKNDQPEITLQCGDAGKPVSYFFKDIGNEDVMALKDKPTQEGTFLLPQKTKGAANDRVKPKTEAAKMAEVYTKKDWDAATKVVCKGTEKLIIKVKDNNANPTPDEKITLTDDKWACLEDD